MDNWRTAGHPGEIDQRSTLLDDALLAKHVACVALQNPPAQIKFGAVGELVMFQRFQPSLGQPAVRHPASRHPRLGRHDRIIQLPSMFPADFYRASIMVNLRFGRA